MRAHLGTADADNQEVDLQLVETGGEDETVIRHTNLRGTGGAEEVTAHHHPPETETDGAREARAIPLPLPLGTGGVDEITLRLPRRSAVKKNHRLVDDLEKSERGGYPHHLQQESPVAALSHHQLEKGTDGEGEVKTIPRPHPQVTGGVGETLRLLRKGGIVMIHLPGDKRGRNHHHHPPRGGLVVVPSHHNHQKHAADSSHQINSKGLPEVDLGQMIAHPLQKRWHGREGRSVSNLLQHLRQHASLEKRKHGTADDHLHIRHHLNPS